MVVVNEAVRTCHKGTTIAKVCAISLLSLSSLDASALTSTAGRFCITAPRTADNIYAEQEANNVYQTKFAEGITTDKEAFYAAGARKKNSTSYTTASLTVTVDNIAVNSSKVGIYNKFGDVTLGGETTKTLKIQSSATGISAYAASSVLLQANFIDFSVQSSTNYSSATGIYVEASNTASDSASSVALNAKDSIHIESILSNSQSDKAVAIGTNGDYTAAGVAGSIINLTADTISLTASAKGVKDRSGAYGIHTQKEDSISITGKSITINSDAVNFSFGIRNDYQGDLSGASISLGSDQTNSVTINSVSTDSSAYGVLTTAADSSTGSITVPGRPGKSENSTSQQFATSSSSTMVASSKTPGSRGSLLINAKQIDISATAKDTASAIELWTNNTATLGNDSSIVNISANSSDGKAYGISSLEGSNITINGAELNVATSGSSGIGISAQNSTQGVTENL